MLGGNAVDEVRILLTLEEALPTIGQGAHLTTKVCPITFGHALFGHEHDAFDLGASEAGDQAVVDPGRIRFHRAAELRKGAPWGTIGHGLGLNHLGNVVIPVTLPGSHVAFGILLVEGSARGDGRNILIVSLEAGRVREGGHIHPVLQLVAHVIHVDDPHGLARLVVDGLGKLGRKGVITFRLAPVGCETVVWGRSG